MVDSVNNINLFNVATQKSTNRTINEQQKYNSVFDIEKDGIVSIEEQKQAIMESSSWEQMKKACNMKGLDFNNIAEQLFSKLDIIKTDGTEYSATKANLRVQTIIRDFYVNFIDKIIPEDSPNQ